MPKTLFIQAENKLRIADHLLSTTYLLVKDPKLLVSVAENLLSAMDNAVDGLLKFEKNFKNINYKKNEKMDIFRRKIVTKYALDPKIIPFINDLKDIVESHKRSNVEFIKKEKFVISDNNYNLHTLSFEDLKDKHKKAKNYINELSKIISQYD